MAKFIARLVVTIACLYGAGAVAFGYFHYEEGQRPDVPGVLSDFNGWMGSLVATRTNPRPSPAPPPATPQAPEPPPAPVEPPAPVDPEERELLRIEKEVLPQAREIAKALRGMDRGDSAAFEAKRTEGMALLGDARTFLNGLLENDPHHRKANTLWGQLQELYRALKSL